MKIKTFVIAGFLGTSLMVQQFVASYSAAADPMTAVPQSVLLNVPYASQVPFGEWNDPRQRDGCEETSLIMALMWVRGAAVPPEEVRRDIINLSAYEQVIYGTFEDTSAEDTASLLRNFYGYPNVTVVHNISTTDIKVQLAAGKLVLVPLNTLLLNHPFYRNGPVRHTVVVTGYDNQQGQIIIHDPIIHQGGYLRLPETAFNRALGDYKTGRHLPLTIRPTSMIVISK